MLAELFGHHFTSYVRHPAGGKMKHVQSRVPEIHHAIGRADRGRYGRHRGQVLCRRFPLIRHVQRSRSVAAGGKEGPDRLLCLRVLGHGVLAARDHNRFRPADRTLDDEAA